MDKNNDVAICWNDVIIKCFWSCFVSLAKFSYLAKFHVNIITASRVMKMFSDKGLTRNPEIGNTHIWVLPNIWRLAQIRDTKVSADGSSEMLLNAAKCKGYSFYHFCVIKGKPTGGREGVEGEIAHPSWFGLSNLNIGYLLVVTFNGNLFNLILRLTVLISTFLVALHYHQFIKLQLEHKTMFQLLQMLMLDLQQY